MKVTAQQIGAEDLLRDLAAAPEKIRRDWAKQSAILGAQAVERIKAEFRTTASDTSTAVRSGQLRRSYAFDVKRTSDGAELTVGAIRPTASGQVPIHARVHEGYDAQGNRVSQFIIRPKNGAWLTFPIRRGAGLAKSNIAGWVRTKQVTLRPRPALEPVGKQLLDKLQAAGLQVVGDAL